MTQKLSTALCNQMMDTGSFKSIFDNGFLKLYSGAIPSSADATIGSAVAEVIIGAPGPDTGVTFEAAAAGGVLSKNTTETWNGTVADTATVTFYRLVTAADDDSADTGVIYPRVQGTIGAGGADMNLDDPDLIAAAPFQLNYFTEALTPS